MILPFDPVVVSIGSLAIRWFGLLALFGLGLAVWRSIRSLEGRGGAHGYPPAEGYRSTEGPQLEAGYQAAQEQAASEEDRSAPGQHSSQALLSGGDRQAAEGQRSPRHERCATGERSSAGEPSSAGAPSARRLALDGLAWGLPAGLLMARLVHVLGWWDYYLTHAGEIWQMNVDGLSLWGGLLGGGLVVFARLSADPLRRRRILDAVAPNVPLGIAVGRLGAFLDGHGQGLPSDLPWATQYANHLAATPDFGVFRHPAQVYDALVCVALFFLASRLPRRLPDGSRLAAMLVAYGAARLMLGAVRLDPPFLFGLQIEQILAIGAIVFGIAFGLRPLLGMRRAGLEQTAAPARRAAEDSLAA